MANKKGQKFFTIDQLKTPTGMGARAMNNDAGGAYLESALNQGRDVKKQATQYGIANIVGAVLGGLGSVGPTTEVPAYIHQNAIGTGTNLPAVIGRNLPTVASKVPMLYGTNVATRIPGLMASSALLGNAIFGGVRDIGKKPKPTIGQVVNPVVKKETPVNLPDTTRKPYVPMPDAPARTATPTLGSDFKPHPFYTNPELKRGFDQLPDIVAINDQKTRPTISVSSDVVKPTIGKIVPSPLTPPRRSTTPTPPTKSKPTYNGVAPRLNIYRNQPDSTRVDKLEQRMDNPYLGQGTSKLNWEANKTYKGSGDNYEYQMDNTGDIMTRKQGSGSWIRIKKGDKSYDKVVGNLSKGNYSIDKNKLGSTLKNPYSK